MQTLLQTLSVSVCVGCKRIARLPDTSNTSKEQRTERGGMDGVECYGWQYSADPGRYGQQTDSSRH